MDLYKSFVQACVRGGEILCSKLNFKTVLLQMINQKFLVVRISQTRLDDFYNSGLSDYCLHPYYYIHYVSADVSSGRLQVFLVVLKNLHGTSNHI